MPKVRAIKTGFFGGARRYPGDVFEVPKGIKAKWFVPADGEAATGPKARGQFGSGSSTEPTNGVGSSGALAADDLQ
ncbi:Phage protein [Burkholderia singularis]|uniref:Phage protein n=1 Tax=Burkholderia singularis TaxID=1503053 RepID=A0A238H7R4_9BURK|nr:Phage protein [Burkholderia singularis]